MDQIDVKNQVTVFGFACNQTPALLPLPIWLAHGLAKRLTEVRREKTLPYLAADGKSQVGIEYRDRTPVRIHNITVIGSQNKDTDAGGPDLKRFQDDIRQTVIEPLFKDETIKPDERTRHIDAESRHLLGLTIAGAIRAISCMARSVVDRKRR